MISFFKNNWEIITGGAVFASGILAFIKNYHHLRNLIFQNRRLKKEMASKKDSVLIDNAFTKSYKVSYNTSARKSMSEFKLTENNVIDYLSLEFNNHTIYARFDYTSLPIPVQGEYFILLTKNESELLIEDIERLNYQSNWFDNWTKLNNEYTKALNLSYRKNHLVLIRKGEFNKSMIIIDNMYKSLTEYYFDVIHLFDNTKAHHFHDLKGNMVRTILHLKTQYKEFEVSNDDKLLADIVLNLETVVSSTHKVLINMRPK